MNDLTRIPVPDEPEEMVLLVEKIGPWVWHFSHGARTFAAPIKDTAWLADFHRGLHPITVGDELRVKVKYVFQNDETGLLLIQSEEIAQVVAAVKSQDLIPGLMDQ